MKNLLLDEISRFMKIFTGSFINCELDIILIPKTNGYIKLQNIHNTLELRCEILEKLSRHCCKTQYYNYHKNNENMWHNNLKKVNIALDTNFTIEDMEVIYSELGNGVNRELTKDFINSNYDMEMLK